MTLGKRHSKEHFSDILDYLKRSFSTGRGMQRRRFDFASKKCFLSRPLEIRGVSRTAVLI